MTTNKKRVIFFAEAVTLAHVARCVTVANALYQTGRYTIALAADCRYDRLLGELPYQRIPLYSVSSQYFAAQLSKGSPLYDVKTLSQYVEQDLEIIDAFKPDFIFGDFRLSLSISSQLKKVPYATITNAYWSPFAKVKYIVPDIFLTKILGVYIAQKIFDIVRPIIFKIHSLALNKTRKNYGLEPLSYDMRECYTHADYIVYADDEALIPMASLPNNHLFMGPLIWSVNLPLPEWWESVPNNKPIVFVTLGSSGDSSNLPIILGALHQIDVTVLCATANSNVLSKRYKNMFIEEYLPSEEAIKKADIVICNGGSPMVYQGLRENKVIIGIPNNLDQYLMMGIIQRVKKGACLRSGSLQKNKLIELLQGILNSLKHQRPAKKNIYKMALEKIEFIIQKETKI